MDSAGDKQETLIAWIQEDQAMLGQTRAEFILFKIFFVLFCFVKPFKVKSLFASFYIIFLPNLHIISPELQSDRYSELQIWTTERSRSHRNPLCRKNWLPTHIVQNCWTGWQKPSRFCSGVLSPARKRQVGIELRTCCLPVKHMDSWQVLSLL